MKVLVAGDRGCIGADSSKLNETFPDLKLCWRVRDGIDELARGYTEHGMTYDDFTSPRFVRLRRICDRLDAGLLDGMLRRQTKEHVSAQGAKTTTRGLLMQAPGPG